MLKTGSKCSFITHKLRFFACFCLVSAASKTFFNSLLDLNYIPWAEKHGAQVRPLHIVRCITPLDNGYRVDFDRIENGRLLPGSETSERVIVAAGSLGSTELLLRCRDQYKTLKGVSQFLDHHWSSNGDFLTPAFYENRTISPTQGPTITCAIDFLDGAIDHQQFFVEDGGFPNLLGNYLEEKFKSGTSNRKLQVLFNALSQIARARDPRQNVMPWFGQAIDAADGRLYLGRRWWAPWKQDLKLDWDITQSEQTINVLIGMHERLSVATGGNAWIPPTYAVLKNLVTPHPLGGCNLGTTSDNGVVDHRGEVFGYRHLYVADGAIIPEAVGLNPSKTIAALSERIAALMT